MDTGDGPDTRFEFMGSFVQKTLKLKPEKWLRLTAVEEHKAVLKEFLDRTHPVVLIIILTQSAQIVPTTSFPLTQLKSKGICSTCTHRVYLLFKPKSNILVLFYRFTLHIQKLNRPFPFPATLLLPTQQKLWFSVHLRFLYFALSGDICRFTT